MDAIRELRCQVQSMYNKPIVPFSLRRLALLFGSRQHSLIHGTIKLKTLLESLELLNRRTSWGVYRRYRNIFKKMYGDTDKTSRLLNMDLC
jgi:hypothetical protein